MSKKRYHHGDLRNALVEAGVKLLETEGPSAVSLRSVARAVGVSQAAPYTHFKNKRGLMSAIATVGFERLQKSLAPLAAKQDCALHDLGLEYIRFALKHPGLYNLMFGSRENIDLDDQELARVSRQTFDILAAKSASKGSEISTDPGPIAAWSLAHGLALLILNERLQPGVGKRLSETLELLEPGIDLYRYDRT